jgi:lipopolysaccharide exporter
VVAWRGVSRLLGVANTIILARLLLPADFGLVAMAMTFETSLLMMSAFPVHDALLRRPEADTDLHDAAFTIQAVRAVLTSLIIAAGAPIAAVWFSEPRLTWLVLALAATTAANGLTNIGIVEFQRELRFDVQFKLQLVPAMLQMLVTVGTAWLTRSYWALVVGLAVLRISTVVMSYAIHPYRPRFSLSGWRLLVGFSFWLWLGCLAGMVWGQVDTFVVGPPLVLPGSAFMCLPGKWPPCRQLSLLSP